VIDGLRARGVAILYISHKLSDLKTVADRVVVLRDGKVVGKYAKPIDFADAIQAMIGRGVRQGNGPRALERSKPVLRISGAKLRADSTPFDFVAHTGEVVAVTGPVGAGKSSLAGAIFGRWPLAEWNWTASRGGRETPANRSGEGCSWREKIAGARPFSHPACRSPISPGQSAFRF
jgi:simple sugar transport system ATP-binding protein